MATSTIVLGLLAVLSSTAVAVKTSGRNCSAGCGDISNYTIPYPFGIGPECSLPGFNLTCATGAGNTSILLLGNPSIKVDDFDGWWTSYSPFLTIRASIMGYLVKLAAGVRDYSVHWEAPGTPFAISGSSNMSLFVVGCGVKGSLFIGNSDVEVGNCSVACVGAETMDRIPSGLCIGIGCCRIDIRVHLRAFTLNISRTGHHAVRAREQVNAFITSQDHYQFVSSDIGSHPTDYSYPVELSWIIPYQPNCERAKEDRASYACVSNHSKCLESPTGGYVCYCIEGTHGNPYVINGCVTPEQDDSYKVYNSMQPKGNCPTSCGNVTLAFPFGTEFGCFARYELYLACIPGPSPILEMLDGSVVAGISVDEGIVRVLKLNPKSFLAHMDTPLYAASGEWGTVKWAIDNISCKDAMTSREHYICFFHSECVDVIDDNTLERVGYRCKCSPGFEGNPYLKEGCTDIDECQSDKYMCNGICQNTFGSYTCNGCPHGTYFSNITRSCKPSTIIVGVTIGVSSGGGILCLAAFIVVITHRWKRSVQKRLRKRYFRKNKGILLEQLVSSDQSTSDGTKIFSLEELEKATNNFDHARVVGCGGHGTVYKGILTDQRVVAIKISKLKQSTEIEQFINEVSILSQINHRNVVKLHGCCLEAEVPLLVYEFISNGTLYDLLHNEQNGTLLPLPWDARLRIAVEIAGALMYLHSASSVSILHRDVKCMNILLNESYTAKVSDFGASRSIPIDQTHLDTAVQGTFGYLDPEYYHTGQLNEKSDVCSFGVILLELLTWKKPIFENENGEKQNLSNYFLRVIGERPLEEIVDEQILGEAREEAIAETTQLAEECLSLTRGERPTMKDVEMRLQMLRARSAGALGPRKRGEEMTNHARSRALKVNGIIGAVAMPAGHNSTRQYSLEQEFVSSARVPR